MIASADALSSRVGDNSTLPVYAGGMVFDPDGRILCQLRDDRPDILYPGYWTCSPGGHVEPGEPPELAVVRELKEEFEIEVSDVQRLTTLVRNEEYAPGTYHAFIAKLVTPVHEVKCNEGQRAEFFTIQEIPELHMHPISLQFLNMYLENPEFRNFPD